MKKISLTSFIIIFISLTSFAQNGKGSSSVQQNSYKMLNGDSSLGQTYNRSACGLNYAVDSWPVSTRYYEWDDINSVYVWPGLGLPAKLNFTKLPSNACFKIDTAFLWWVVSHDSKDDTDGNYYYIKDTALKYCSNPDYHYDVLNGAWWTCPASPTPSSLTPTVTIKNSKGDSSSFTGKMIGKHGPKQWNELGTRTFRADVTNAITGNGNYTINITGNTQYEVDGFTLFIVYRDPSAIYQGTLLIDDGCITNGNANGKCGYPTTDSITGFSACDNSTNATAFMLTSDLQSNAAETFQATLNGKTVTDSSKFFNFSSSSTTVTKGQNISKFGVTQNFYGSDCYTLAVTGLYYQTTSCVTCLPQDTSTSLTLTKSSTPAMCGNNTGTATVSPTGGARPYKYSWSPYGGSDSVAKNLAPGTYKVIISDNACKSKVDSVVVTTAGGFSLPHPTQTNVTCFAGGDGTATAAPTGGKQPYVISWNTTPAQTTAKASSLKANIYYRITVQDGDGCVLKDSVKLTQPNDLVFTTKADSAYCGQSNGTATVTVVSGGTTPYSYLWGTTPAQTSTSATGLKAGVYTVSVKYSAVCHKDTTVIVPNAGGFKATYSKTNVLCFGDSTGTAKVISSGGKKPYKYNWSSGGTDSVAKKLKVGTYSVTTTDANQCSVTIPVITISQPTVLLVAASDTSICISKSATIRVSASGGIPTYTYSWSNAVTTTSQTVTPDITTNYIITVTDSNKCKKTDTATVKVTQPPMATVSSSGAIDLCTNDSVTLTINAPGATSYSWNTGETTASITVRPNTTTIYKATAATNNCLGVESSFTVNVSTTKVTSDFSATPVKGPVPLTVNFTNKSINGKNYIWIFGDNSGESNLSNPPSHIFDSAGKFTIQLIAIDGNCSDTSLKTIEVIPVSSLGLPNVFTPNGDSRNDKFKPIIQRNIATLTVTIYNRWGEKMTEWAGTSGGWDGWDGKTKGGSLAPDGVYYYILDATGQDEKPYHEKGFVTLIRGRE